jgi:PKD repeat protein
LDVLKTELIAARVIIYQGFSSTSSNASGHCFVADGFDINNFIHFNWGWGGSYDGYFSVASLIPSGSGTGGGAGNYTSNQGALIGLRPPTTSAPVADFSATSTITNVGSTITLTDLSTDIPNSWIWTITPSTFTFVNGTSNNSKFPEVTFTASGQYTITLSSTNSKGTGSLTKTAYIIVNPALASQVCDTLTNFSSTDQKVNYTINGGGYMAGHNVSNLKGYTEYYPSNTPYTHISGVVLEFAHAEASNSTNTISVNLYSNNSNKPGAILTSKTVKLIDIVNDVNNNRSTTVLFDTPYQLTGSFYVGYTLTYAAGDTVSVYTGKSGTITTNTSFFQFPSGNWKDYKSGWGENQHLKISPMISTMPSPNFTITSSPALVNTNVIIDASSSVGAYAYNWTIANANITSSKFYQETISYGTPGTYDIILDVTGGCGTTKQITKQIIINSNCTTAPVTPGTISGITSVCSGSTNITYTVAAISGASSYAWTLPTGITGTSSTNTINVNISNTIQSGSIRVSAVNSCGTSAEATLTITINALPIVNVTASATNIYSGQPVTLTASGATTYIWDNNVSNGIAFNPIASKTYTVIGTDGNNCTNTANVLITVLSLAGLEKLNFNGSFNAYFNSASDELIINTTIDKTSNINVTLLNSAGQEIYNQMYTNYLGEFKSNINVNTFETGVYVLKMDTNQGVISKKFVIN